MLILPITLYPHKSRVITFYSCDDKTVPPSLFDEPVSDCDFSPVYPTPFRKRDFKTVKKYGDTYWIGGDKGLFRYCDGEKEYYDKVMYFSADRDLKDNKVINFCGNENEIWVRTETAVSHIELKMMSMEEKAEMLRAETVKIVYRKGMISHRNLQEPWNTEKPEKFNCCDNDGGFTASFCIGEILHYAVLRKEKGADHPETIETRKIARRALDACLLLMYIPGRADGFIARSYVTTDAPVPDDGLFLYREGDTVTVAETSASISRGISKKTYKMPHPEIPECLRYLYEDEGYTADDLVFKCDTSSDEVTLHLVNLYYAHIVFGEEEPALDEMIKTNVALVIDHIISNGYEYVDFHGGATSWAKWSMRYFNTPLGWGDGPLNGAELLMFLKLAMSVCGNEERWVNEYSKLIENGYAEMNTLHYDRAFAASIIKHCDPTEDIMYGDHMLSNLTYFMLNLLEDNEELRSLYFEGWQSWRQTSTGREHHPVYDIPFAYLYGGDSYYDEDKIKMWYYRHNCSMLASGVSLVGRSDIAVKEYKAGYRQTSYLLTPDEKFISKHDRDPLEYKNEDSHGKYCVEMCSPYTMSYWMGRYYGVLEEGGNENG